MNGLTDDMERIHIFERKLKVITGLENVDMTGGNYQKGDVEPDHPLFPPKPENLKREPQSLSPSRILPQGQLNIPDDLKILKDKDALENTTEFKDYKKLYEEKIAKHYLGIGIQ